MDENTVTYMQAGLMKEFFINYKPDGPVTQLSRDLSAR